MILVIGGAYQGKLAFALEHGGFGRDDVFFCGGDGRVLAAEKPVISGLHLLLLQKVQAGEDCLAWAQAALPALRGKYVLCDDISAGVVPVEADLRAWREATGRVLALFARESDEVYRLFCCLAQRLK